MTSRLDKTGPPYSVLVPVADNFIHWIILFIKNGITAIGFAAFGLAKHMQQDCNLITPLRAHNHAANK